LKNQSQLRYPVTGGDSPSQYPVEAKAVETRRTVLYVEDHVDNVMLMESIFEELEDVTLICVYSAEQGIDRIKSDPPDMVLMDINLPGMDGFTALKLMKASMKTWDIPVIAITSNATPGDIEAGKIAGFDAYVTKPLDVSKLIGIIQDTFESYA